MFGLSVFPTRYATKTHCHVAYNNRSMYVDTHHLNRYRAVYVAEHIRGELA